MGYTTIAAVRLASGFSDNTKILDATITLYIADADSVIDGSIRSIYQTPLVDAPDVIEMISRHMVVGLLYANEYGEETENLDKGWKSRLEWAESQLEKIRKQELQLVDTDGDEFARSTQRQPAFKPTTASSDPDATDSDKQKLSMNQQF